MCKFKFILENYFEVINIINQVIQAVIKDLRRETIILKLIIFSLKLPTKVNKRLFRSVKDSNKYI